MRALRTLRIMLWAMVGVLGTILAIALVFPPGPGRQQAATISGAPLGGPFRLIDQEGRPVTEAALRGRPSALFFGFTHCPDVCPTTLAELDAHLDRLDEKGREIAAYFVTVDPERDTPDVLRNYVGAVSDRIVGLTGEPQAVAAMLKDYGVYAKRVPLKGGGYTMDHTASVFLLDSEGRLVSTISHGEDGEAAFAKLEKLAAT